jgi:hypothetical protein
VGSIFKGGYIRLGEFVLFFNREERAMKRLRVVGLMFAMLSLVLLSGYGGAWVAQAQSVVMLELTSPVSTASARILQVTYENDGSIVGEFNGFLLVFGAATSTASTSVTEEPDSAEVTFRVPYNGVTTTIVVDSVDFGSPIPLPPGDDPTIDPFIIISVEEVSGDNVAPTCTSSQPDSETIIFEVRDAGSGLSEIIVSEDFNADVTVPDFEPGTTDTVTVIADILDTSRTATVRLKVIDEAGNRAYCKRSVRSSLRTRSWSRSWSFGW